MNRKAIAIASLVVAVPAPALAAGSYHVRNDTGRTLSCGLRRAHGESMDRFVLRAGAGWSQTSEDEGARTLYCDFGRSVPGFRLRSGVHYTLVQERGRFALRVAPPR